MLLLNQRYRCKLIIVPIHLSIYEATYVIGELFNMISLSIVDVVFNGLFVTSIPLTTSYSLFLFKRSCGNIYLNYRNQTMDVSRLYLWIPSAALFPLTATP